MITSTRNPLVKELRRLHERRHREEDGRFLIDGVRLVEEALRSGAPVEQLIAVDPPPERMTALLNEAAARSIAIVPVAPHVLEAVSGVETPQGVAAVVRFLAAAPEEVLDRRELLLLVVDRVQDPGNLGTIIRSADAAGASAVALTPGTVDAYNPKAVRATMGSLFHLPVFRRATGELIADLRARLARIIGTDAEAPVDFREARYDRPLAVVIGNEGEGLAPEWRAAADLLVRIPIFGRAESLNAAVAATLVLYAAASRLRGREGAGE